MSSSFFFFRLLCLPRVSAFLGFAFPLAGILTVAGGSDFGSSSCMKSFGQLPPVPSPGQAALTAVCWLSLLLDALASWAPRWRLRASEGCHGRHGLPSWRAPSATGRHSLSRVVRVDPRGLCPASWWPEEISAPEEPTRLALGAAPAVSPGPPRVWMLSASGSFLVPMRARGGLEPRRRCPMSQEGSGFSQPGGSGGSGIISVSRVLTGVLGKQLPVGRPAPRAPPRSPCCHSAASRLPGALKGEGPAPSTESLWGDPSESQLWGWLERGADSR